MNGRLIIKLPTSLSANIISEWLSVKDRVRLDSAHCQAFVRDEFLQMIRSPELSVKSMVQDTENHANRALVSWALLREVYVEKLIVRTESDPDLYNAYLQKFASRVFFLRLNCSRTNSLAQSVAGCRNLLVLKVHNWELSASLRDVFVCCERLREFYGYSCVSRRCGSDPDPSDLPLTSAHLETVVCKNVKYLELVDCNVDLVAAFLRMAVAVEVVVLLLAVEDVPLMDIQMSMSLTTSTLSLKGITLDAGLANLTPRGAQLENLSFPWCGVANSANSSLCKFPNIRALDLTYAIFETEDYLSVLASSCGDKLTELLLYSCEPTLSLFTVQETLPLFTKLQSFSFHFEDDDTTIWEISSFSKLTKLSLCYYGFEKAELVSQLTKHCHANIRELSLRMFSSDFAAQQVDLLVSKCTKLRCFNLEDIESSQLHQYELKIAKWKSLRPGLAVGGNFELQLNVFDKFECSGAW